jgi:hypothetical protein
MSTELQTTNQTFTPVNSMRQVETTDQLEWILKKALLIINKRDEYYEATKEHMEYRSKANEQARIHQNATGCGGIAFAVLMSGIAGFAVGGVTYGLTLSAAPSVIIGLILAVLLALAIIKIEQARAEKNYTGYDDIAKGIEHKMERTETAIKNQQNLFWCAEIIPIDYRNQKAVEIMLSAIRKSRADNWRECCDIYDKECEREEMREYQAAQLALSQEAATNSKWAAAGAWASFGAILFK